MSYREHVCLSFICRKCGEHLREQRKRDRTFRHNVDRRRKLLVASFIKLVEFLGRGDSIEIESYKELFIGQTQVKLTPNERVYVILLLLILSMNLCKQPGENFISDRNRNPILLLANRAFCSSQRLKLFQSLHFEEDERKCCWFACTIFRGNFKTFCFSIQTQSID